MDILSPLQNDRLKASHQELQCGKHTGRTCTDDDYRLSGGHIPVIFKHIFLNDLIRLVHLHPITVEDVVAGIYGTAHDAVSYLRLHLRRHAKRLYCCSLDFIRRELLS